MLRPLSIGEILDGGFTIYRQYFTKLVGMGLLLLSLPMLAGIAAAIPDDQTIQAILSLPYALLNGIASIALGAACVWLTSQVVLARPVDIREAAGKGLQKFFPVFLCGLLLLLGYSIIVGLPAGIAFGVWSAVFSDSPALFGVGIVFFAVAIGVTVIIMALMAFALVPVVVLEDTWSFFSRSRALARKSWLKIAIVTFIYTIVVALPAIVVGAGSVLQQAMSGAEQFSQPIWVVFANALVAALTTPFANACLTLLYYDQRVRKEGLDVELSASAIDTAPAGG